ncbi:hypothetical protein X992_5578 [Burkholderia pseudomallei MSHR5492]|nr:hypothetical protein X992_5578 [Burkholderia pseudomallei MSHR5492]
MSVVGFSIFWPQSIAHDNVKFVCRSSRESNKSYESIESNGSNESGGSSSVAMMVFLEFGGVGTCNSRYSQALRECACPNKIYGYRRAINYRGLRAI